MMMMSLVAQMMVGAIDQKDLMTWSAVVSTVVMGAIPVYQAYRSARRKEDQADDAAQAETFKRKLAALEEQGVRTTAIVNQQNRQISMLEKERDEWRRLYRAASGQPMSSDSETETSPPNK